MIHLSIYWKNNSDELAEMLRQLGDPGAPVGNEGCEIVCTVGEYVNIAEYAAEHPDQMEIEIYRSDLTESQAWRMASDWKTLGEENA